MGAHGHARARKASGGFTVVELAFSMVLLGTLLGATFMLTQGGLSAFRSTDLRTSAESRARRALDRVCAELVRASEATLFPDASGQFGTDTLSYSQVVGLDAGAVQFGPTMRIAFEYAEGELDDGVDNDGNGVVDDGVIVMTTNVGEANETRIVLCRDVSELLEGETVNGDDDNDNGVIDEAGFSIRRVDDVMFVRLSIEQRGAQGELVIVTVESAIELRN